MQEAKFGKVEDGRGEGALRWQHFRRRRSNARREGGERVEEKELSFEPAEPNNPTQQKPLHVTACVYFTCT